MSMIGNWGMRKILRLRTSASGERGELHDEPANKRRGLLKGLRLAGEDGQTLVEFAFVLPLMMIVLTGAASLSLALYNLMQLSNATASTTQQLGAQAGSVPNNDPCAAAATSVTKMLPNWTASKLTYTLAITDTTTDVTTTNGPTTGSGFTCVGANMPANGPMTLTVTYAYTWFPIFDFSPSTNLTTSESALIE